MCTSTVADDRILIWFEHYPAMGLMLDVHLWKGTLSSCGSSTNPTSVALSPLMTVCGFVVKEIEIWVRNN